MNSYFKSLTALDRRALILTTLMVGLFFVYIIFFDGGTAITALIEKSHKSAKSADIFCAKKENRNSSYCLGRKAEVDAQWQEIGAGSTGVTSKKSSNIFTLSK